MILSMDALFGLPRKKAAGQSVRDAIYMETCSLRTRFLWMDLFHLQLLLNTVKM